MKKILVTGAAGFIGSNFVHLISREPDVFKGYSFVFLDSLTYAGRLENIDSVIAKNEAMSFVKLDIRDQKALASLFEEEGFYGVIHYAAESHVDNSIESPGVFVETNVLGTQNLLGCALDSYKKNKNFKFLQVSTDEVYGELALGDPGFTENHPISPNSPYSASKAGGDLLVRAFHETYGLPTVITRCSNNYGPFQFPEKLIPVMINKALRDEALPVYGDGSNVRDWIFVDDHNRGVWKAFADGQSGEVYNFGGNAEMKNLDLVKHLLQILGKEEDLISFVTDRLGHDFRYAIDYSKATKDLNWEPQVKFSEGIRLTVDWYQQNEGFLSR